MTESIYMLMGILIGILVGLKYAQSMVRCKDCKDTGLSLWPGDDVESYRPCPIGEALGAAWMGTGHEEETLDAIDKMRAFLLSKP